MATIIGKASRNLNFLKRNLNNCSTDVKEATYLAIVRPPLEYALIVWDPIYNNDLHTYTNLKIFKEEQQGGYQRL